MLLDRVLHKWKHWGEASCPVGQCAEVEMDGVDGALALGTIFLSPSAKECHHWVSLQVTLVGRFKQQVHVEVQML